MIDDEGQVWGEDTCMIPETGSLLLALSLSLSLSLSLCQDASSLLAGPGKPNMI